ncbi:MAG: 4Fe-4S binding protein [Candidatus Jordarchaeaceae archaeon]
MKIDRELCGLCMGCASVCPRNALSVTEHEVKVNNQACNNCGVCVKVCPIGAIIVEENMS